MEVDLAKPLDSGSVCGINIRNDTDAREIYYRLKDARNQARAEERAVSPGEPFKLSQDWNLVSNLGLQIISSISKDIEVLAWLAEAHLRLYGFSGLTEVYVAITSLVRDHWDDLHSIDDEDVEERVAPLAGLNGIGSEGALIQAIRLVSLVPDRRFGETCVWDYQLGQRPGEQKRREELEVAASEAGVAAMTAHLLEVLRCHQAFIEMNAVLADRCGSNAPPSSYIRSALQDVMLALKALGARDDSGETAAIEPAASPVAPGMPVATVATARPTTPEGIASRDEAFELLLTVARYFRRTEPHSPISLAIETLVRRGRMDFSELLAELLPEPQVRNAVLTAAGIKPAKDT